MINQSNDEKDTTGDDLYKLTKDLYKKIYEERRNKSESDDLKDLRRHWSEQIALTDSVSLIYLTSRLTSDEDKLAATVKALREGIISEIERKNANHLAETLKNFENSVNNYSKKLTSTITELNDASSKIAKRSYLVAAIAAFLAILQVVLAALPFLKPR